MTTDENLDSMMNQIQEQKDTLWTAWMEDKNFERVLRRAIRNIEARKLDHPEMNINVAYQQGRLDGYVELFEQLFRVREKERAIRNDAGLRTAINCRILEALYKTSDLRHGDIADAVYISRSSLTYAMEKLLLSGAVEEVRSGQNIRYHLTDAGRKFYEHVYLGKN